MKKNVVAKNGKKETKVTMHGFDIEMIRSNLKNVQDNFPEINKQIRCARDFLSDEIIENLLQSYILINQELLKNPKKHRIANGIMLELNYIVNTNIGFNKRKEHRRFLEETEKKYLKYIGGLSKWYDRHDGKKDDPYDTAAGLYVRILACPQLFIEGNHRTGALVANYHLLMSQKDPFILTVENAVEFFNLASDVKFKKDDMFSRFKRLANWRDEKERMCEFLKNNTRPFVYDLCDVEM